MTQGLENQTLTQQELRACRPRPGEGGRVLRALCPFHGSDKQRSLRVEIETGRFQCFSCGAWGYMAEARERFEHERQKERERLGEEKTSRVRGSSGPSRARLLRPPERVIEPARSDLEELLEVYQAALPGSWGQEYLKRRGLSLELAQAWGVGYAGSGQWAHRNRDWKWGRVVFGHTVPDGTLVNLYGRAVGSDDKVPKAVRHDHLPGAKGYFNASGLKAGSGPVFVCEGAFDALSLLAAGCERVVALYGVHGWRLDWLGEVSELVFALDADQAGEQWRQLARDACLRGKEVHWLPASAYGGKGDVSEAWAAGVLSKAIGNLARPELGSKC